MAAKVTIELDDQVSGPMQAVEQAAEGAAAGFDDMAGSASRLESEIQGLDADQVADAMQNVDQSAYAAGDAIDDMRDDIAGLESEVRELVDALNDQADANRKVDNSQQQVQASGANVAQKITAISTGTLAAIEVFKKMGEAAKKAYELIKAGADAGNPAAIAVVDSVGKLQSALAEVANDPLIQDFLKGMADTITSQVVPAIAQIPDAWRGAQNWIAGAITATTDFVGITEGAAEASAEMADQQARAVEHAKALTAEAEKKFKADKSLAAVDADLAKLAEAKRQNGEKEALAAIKNTDELQTRLKAETETLRKMAADGELTDSARQQRLADITAIEQRLVDLKKEQTDETAKAAEAQKKAVDDMKDGLKSLAEQGKAVWEKMNEARKKSIAEATAKEKAAVDELANKLKELKGEDGQAQDVVGKIKGSLTDDQVLQQIGSNRQKSAEDAARAAGKDDKQIKAAGRKAYATAGKQANAGGQFDQAEVAAAQDSLTSSIVDQAASSGELSVQQSKALRQAAAAQMEAAKVQAEQAATIEEITGVLEEITNGTKKIGQRQRAQRGSSGR
jgi:hypothetical protein